MPHAIRYDCQTQQRANHSEFEPQREHRDKHADNRKQGEPAWLQKDRGYEPHTEAGELFNLATDPTQKHNRYATETAKVKELATLMERYVTEGRSTPGPKQKNDLEITWDKRAGK